MASPTQKVIPCWHAQQEALHYGLPGQPARCGSTITAPVYDAIYVNSRQHGWHWRCTVCLTALLQEKEQ